MPDHYAVWLERDVLGARGPEAAAYLEGQLSQDVLSIADGFGAWSWLLSPQGKVDALVRVTRLSEEDWLLDTDAGWGEAVLARLNKFKLRTKVEFEARPWKALGLLFHGVVDTDAANGVATAGGWPALGGVDVLGPDVKVPEGWQEMDPAEYEARRIIAGMPKMGAELDEKTIPAETGWIDWTVSFTKGCYTGQELVARIDSRGGNVPRHLRGLLLNDRVEAGTELFDGDQMAGTVTSVARSAERGWVGLGYVRRAYQPPLTLSAGVGGPDVAVSSLQG